MKNDINIPRIVQHLHGAPDKQLQYKRAMLGMVSQSNIKLSIKKFTRKLRI